MANFKEQKKYHFTYKTTNLINGRYYLGMHSTNRIDDGYLGSGKRLYYELNKYGRDNFKFEILEQFDSREELVQAEINLITEQDVKNSNCLNLKQGGEGGWSEEVRKKGKIAAKAYMEEKWKNPEYREKMIGLMNNTDRKDIKKARTSNTLKQYYKNNPGISIGRVHKPETIEKMKQSHKGQGLGDSNSQFGTCWITNELESKKVTIK